MCPRQDWDLVTKREHNSARIEKDKSLWLTFTEPSIMVSEKDLDSPDHEDFEESDDGDDRQRRGANQRRSHGICQKVGLIREQLYFLKKLPQFFNFLSGSSAMDHAWVFLPLGPAVKNHISPKMAKESIATFGTTYHSLSLVYQRVLPLRRPHLLRHHLHRRIL